MTEPRALFARAKYWLKGCHFNDAAEMKLTSIIACQSIVHFAFRNDFDYMNSCSKFAEFE
jgi:hypothetical protein